MSDSTDRPSITEADIVSRAIPRRRALGRVGLAVATLGVAGVLQACGGGESASSDADEGSDTPAAEASAPAVAPTASPDSASTPDSASDSSDSDSQ